VWVNAPADCGWDAISLSSFIHITENPQGSGHLNFRVSVENNPQAYGRRGTVVVRKTGYPDWEITVNQAGNPDAPDPGGVISYYHTDALGSVRMITDANGGVVSRHDYLPFGQTFGATSNPIGNRLFFTGKERDSATGTSGWSALDYVGARYYQSQTGRFTSPDPITVNALRIVNPQRWNQFAYAVNNPLSFTDPDGLDAIAFNFVGGAFGAGHAGVMSVNPNGSGTYGGFNPVHGGRPFDRGTVVTIGFEPGSIKFGENGRPTAESWAMIKRRIAQDGNHDPRLIRAAYYKTSAAETAALEQFIVRAAAAPPSYNVLTRSCQTFCSVGLNIAGIPAPEPTGVMNAPNVHFQSLWLLDWLFRLSEVRTPKATVTTSYCFQGEASCQ
jgi:RHS repeat-associated protein